jgi:sortase A
MGCAAGAAFFIALHTSNAQYISLSTSHVSKSSIYTEVHLVALDIKEAPPKNNPINRLVIPSIGVDAYVETMGIEKNGKMAVPDNYTDVGLYEGSVPPGERGSAVMGAHVDNGSSINGVFKKLSLIETGDEIFYFNQKGEKITFTVSNKEIYDRDKKDTSKVFSQHDTERLNLITCFGEWLPHENTYDKRLVVYTELQSRT